MPSLTSVQAIACLKRASYLAPFEWMVSFNLGLAHLKVKQYASAFQFFSATINLNPSFGPAFAMLGVSLMNLNDHANAEAALQKAAELDTCDSS